MNLLDAAIPPQFKLAVAGGVLAIILVLAGGWTVCHLHNVTLTHDLEAEQTRNSDLAAKVLQADEAVAQAKAINGRMTQALQAQNSANAAAQAQIAQLEGAARAAMTKAATVAAAARTDDAKRRARADLPSADEMTAVLAGVLGAM